MPSTKCFAVALARGMSWGKTNRQTDLLHIVTQHYGPAVSLCGKPAVYPLDEAEAFNHACPTCLVRMNARIESGKYEVRP